MCNASVWCGPASIAMHKDSCVSINPTCVQRIQQLHARLQRQSRARLGMHRVLPSYDCVGSHPSGLTKVVCRAWRWVHPPASMPTRCPPHAMRREHTRVGNDIDVLLPPPMSARTDRLTPQHLDGAVVGCSARRSPVCACSAAGAHRMPAIAEATACVTAKKGMSQHAVAPLGYHDHTTHRELCPAE